MPSKINWIDNLRGIACLMVVMIHTTTWYVTNAHSISPVNWDIANILNSASRVSVPLFFMISGFLFFGERSAQPRHFIRIAACLGFYSAVALLYITLFTSINAGLSLKYLLQKPVFYHLWFFFAIIVIYLVSPLIQVKNVSGKMLLALMVVIGIVANPNTVSQKIDGFEWLPVNLYINGDTFYYVFDESSAVKLRDSEAYGFNGYVAMFEKGEAVHYDSVEKASEELNLPNLADAIEANNAAALAGEPDEFGRRNCPYIETRDGLWAIRVDPTFYLTTAGLAIDTDCHVLTEDKKAIPGLYAAGDVCGSIEEKDAKQYGMGFDAALTYGYIMGETLKKEI